MFEPAVLISWEIVDSDVVLRYSDDDVFSVSLIDFNRAFGTIISGSKTDIYRDFAIPKN